MCACRGVEEEARNLGISRGNNPLRYYVCALVKRSAVLDEMDAFASVLEDRILYIYFLFIKVLIQLTGFESSIFKCKLLLELKI